MRMTKLAISRVGLAFLICVLVVVATSIEIFLSSGAVLGFLSDLRIESTSTNVPKTVE